ncbi:hypothetical protein JCM3775_004316 [Rhodotorula graminis]
MQLRMPKPKGEPKRTKRPPIVSTPDAPPCGICEKQISRYTCPNCNLAYCSLACFRDPQHQACVDHFQRATLAQDLEGDPHHAQPSSSDKNRMLDMLKKFEDQQRELDELERQDSLDHDDDDDAADQSPEAVARRKERQELEKRLEGIDLDAVPPDQLLSFLSPSQQTAFSATLLDPARLTKLVEDQFEGDEPWWVEEDELRVLKDMRDTSRRAAREAGGTVDGEGEGEGASGGSGDEDEDEEDPMLRPPVLHPEQLPPLKVGPDGRPLVSPKLLHNIAAVLFAYAFTLRTFSLSSFASLPVESSERTTAIQVLASLVPFLVERSTAAFDDLETAVEAVVQQEEQGMPSPLVALLLQDVSALLRPNPVALISPSSSPLASHALSAALHALSDVHHLFAVALSTSTRRAPAPQHATHQTGGAGPTITKPLISRPSTAAALSKPARAQCALGGAKALFYAALLGAPQGAGAGVVEACGALSGEARELAGRREREEREREGRVERAREERERRAAGEEEDKVGAPGKKVAFQEDARGGRRVGKDEGPRIVEL